MHPFEGKSLQKWLVDTVFDSVLCEFSKKIKSIEILSLFKYFVKKYLNLIFAIKKELFQMNFTEKAQSLNLPIYSH